MALTYRQFKLGTQAPGTTVNYTMDSVLLANPNLVDFLATFAAQSGGASACSDDINGAHTRQEVATSLAGQAAMFHRLNSGAGTPTITMAPNANDWFHGITVEFSGVNVIVEASGSQSGTGTAVLSGSVTVAGPAIIFAIVSYFSGDRPIADAGWNEIEFSTSLGVQPFSVVYQNVTAGTYQPSWTAPGSVVFQCCTVAFSEFSSPVGSGQPFITSSVARRFSR